MGNRATVERPSCIENRTVPLRRPNAELRPREYLTEREVEALIDAARKHGRHGHRDATAILLAYRHGLRATEMVELTWDMIELTRLSAGCR
jgi:type 1 fimbriae regulatory protein FimE